jgi:hypothetical protein
MAGHLIQATDFRSLLAAPARSPEIPESADVYGWLCGSWDLEVLRYRGIDVSGRGLSGEVHAGRVLEGRAVQDVWIMPRPEHRGGDVDRGMNMYGTTLRSWDASIDAWRIAWTNPVSGHREEGRPLERPGHSSGSTRPDGTKTRWTFTEITPTSFHWRGEAASEQGNLDGRREFIATRRSS